MTVKKGEDSATTPVSRLKGKSRYNGALIPLGPIVTSKCLDCLFSSSHFNRWYLSVPRSDTEGMKGRKTREYDFVFHNIRRITCKIQRHTVNWKPRNKQGLRHRSVFETQLRYWCSDNIPKGVSYFKSLRFEPKQTYFINIKHHLQNVFRKHIWWSIQCESEWEFFNLTILRN